MTTQFGVTPAGFAPKMASDVLADIEADQLALLGPTVDTSPSNPLGQLNGIIAAKCAEVWQIIAAVAAVTNRNAPTTAGALLDNAGALTGSLRRTVTPSYVLCSLTFSASGTYVAGSLVAYVPGSPSVTWSNAVDVVVPADPPVSSTTPYTATGVLVTSVEDGPDAATALNAAGVNMLTAMVPVSGWLSITNPANAVPGALEETDTDFRVRQEEELAASGAGTVPAMTGDLLEIPSVQSVTIYNNVTDYVDPVTGTPPHAFQALVFDGLIPPAGNNDLIAQAIWNDLTPGIRTYGSSSGTAIDNEGNPQVVYFTRPAQVPVYMAVTVSLAPGVVLATIAPLIKAALVGASSGQAFESFGTQVTPPAALQQPAFPVVAMAYRTVALGVPGVTDVPALALDIAPSPTATANITIAPNAIAVLETSNITLNGI